jgi:hypothetical protein
MNALAARFDYGTSEKTVPLPVDPGPLFAVVP